MGLAGALAFRSPPGPKLLARPELSAGRPGAFSRVAEGAPLAWSGRTQTPGPATLGQGPPARSRPRWGRTAALHEGP